MTLVVTPLLDAVFKALGDFVEGVLPAGVVVIVSDANRVPSPPPDPGYVEMTLRRQNRIMTNLDNWDAQDPDPAAIDIEQAIELTLQLDCYGADSGDWAAILSTVLRDEYAVNALDPSGVAPLHADDPRFAPLVAGEEQYERRWIVEAKLQYNPVTSTPMQFANALAVADLINVDVSYPP